MKVTHLVPADANRWARQTSCAGEASGSPATSGTGFTRRRYDRYVQLLTRWATHIGTSPELVEMWLVERWSARVRETREGSRAEPTLF
ncbi:8-oxoguanine DNA glycosylase OGG fold protein [Rhodococcus wratislaviensis]|nr:hypothetical protein [Rhodococcus wratislaviensis]